MSDKNGYPFNLDEHKAINCARLAALRYKDDHYYLPQSVNDALEWEPHAWIIQALKDAYLMGRYNALQE